MQSEEGDRTRGSQDCYPQREREAKPTRAVLSTVPGDRALPVTARVIFQKAPQRSDVRRAVPRLNMKYRRVSLFEQATGNN